MLLIISFLMVSFSLSSGSFLNFSAILNSSNPNATLDQDMSETQDIPMQDFNWDLMRQHGAGFTGGALDLINQNGAGFAGGVVPAVSLSEYLQPPSDLKLFEALQLDSNSPLGQQQNFPSLSTEHGQPTNFNEFDQFGNTHNYDEGGVGDYNNPVTQNNIPNIGLLLGQLGGLQTTGVKTLFPKHKLKKYLGLRHHHGLFRKHRGIGNYLGNVGAYIGGLAQHVGNSLYYQQIPKFTPFPIHFPSLESGSFDLEATVFKSMLIPLAGVALFGAAAAAMLVTNPFVWSLPAFSLLIGHTTFGSYFGRKRRRRDASGNIGSDNSDKDMNDMKKKLEEIKILDDFLQKASSKREVIIQEKKLLATYLMTQAICLERLVCSLHRPKLPETLNQEGIVMNIVTKEILENEFVPQVIRDDILRARQVGLASGNCQAFLCLPNMNQMAYRQT